jgi:hypothetical protein
VGPALLERITQVWGRTAQLDVFLTRSPLVEVTLDDARLRATEHVAA